VDFGTRQILAEQLQYPFSMPSSGRRLSRLRLDSLRHPETGQLVRPVQGDAVAVPTTVTLREGALHFTWPRPDATVTTPIPTNLLERFLALRTDAEILRFAQRYGRLGVKDALFDGIGAVAAAMANEKEYLDLWAKQHPPKGIAPIPLSDAEAKAWEAWGRRLRRLWIDHDGPQSSQEPVAEWRRYQREFNGWLAVTAALRDGDRQPYDVLTELAELGAFFPKLSPETAWVRLSSREQTQSAWTGLALRSEQLVAQSGLRPGLRWTFSAEGAQADLVFQTKVHSNPRDYFGVSLFGALVFQLLAAIAGTGFATCSACRVAYVPRRRPRLDQHHYCPRCGRSAAVRDAKARYRARLAQRRKHSGRSGK
jgi:predicted RNA-binding Zn-ribbon protein involved in translation (DUF1610 family)